MPQPITNITFTGLAQTAILRSGRGVVALILEDETKSDLSYVITEKNLQDNRTNFTAENYQYIVDAFAGKPNKVLVEIINEDTDLSDALGRLQTKKWNYLSMPSATIAGATVIITYITAQSAKGKTYKAVLADSLISSTVNNMRIINFATASVVDNGVTYTDATYCPKIAGILAGISLAESATSKIIDTVTSIAESTDADSDADNGKLILISDGENYKLGRAVNTLTTLSEDQTLDMKKIKIVEGMDMIAEDIKLSFDENYRGKVINSYSKKLDFIGEINQYLGELEPSVLYEEYDNSAEIDVSAQKDWLENTAHKDTSDWSDAEIKEANTASNVFVVMNVQFADAMEDLYVKVIMN